MVLARYRREGRFEEVTDQDMLEGKPEIEALGDAVELCVELEV